MIYMTLVSYHFLHTIKSDISDIAYTDEGDAIFEIEGEIAKIL